MGKDERHDVPEEEGGGRGKKRKWPPAVSGPPTAGSFWSDLDWRKTELSLISAEALSEDRTREVFMP